MNFNPEHLPTYKALFPVLRNQTGPEDNDEHKVLFMGTYKNGKKQCGFETPMTSGESALTGRNHADIFTTDTSLNLYENGAQCLGEDILQSLLKAKYITKYDYDMYQDLPDEEDNEEADNSNYPAEHK